MKTRLAIILTAATLLGGCASIQDSYVNPMIGLEHRLLINKIKTFIISKKSTGVFILSTFNFLS